MRLDDFRTLVDRLVRDLPPTYLDGVVAVEVSPKTIPDPTHADVYTLGECIPLEWSGNGADLQSRIVLYHGSFAALAGGGSAPGELDWRRETWETLSHEVRHHLEWRADVDALEAYDWAAEQNFARHEGEPFDPAFYRSGELLAAGVYKVDDDVFIENVQAEEIMWHGRRYRVPTPQGARPPLFLTLDGLLAPPAGEAVLVVPRRASLLDLLRRRPPSVARHVVRVTPFDG